MAHRIMPRRQKHIIPIVMALLAMLLLSACGSNAQTQQTANQSKTQLDSLLNHAQSIGIPGSMLQSILNQEAQITDTNAPITVFNNQPDTDYYSNLTQRYQILAVQVRGLESQVTQQYDYQAYLNIQSLEKALAERQSQRYDEAKTFAAQLNDDQAQLAKAKYPKDYIKISLSAQRSTQALHLLGPAYDNIKLLRQVIKQMQASHLDVSALDQAGQRDLQLFHTANKPEDFTKLMDEVNTQLQEATVISIQALPYVGAAKLIEFSTNIQLAGKYGVNITTFQQHLNADQIALKSAKNFHDYVKVSTQIDSDLASIQLPVIRGEANYLLKAFHQEVTTWGNAHKYHDPQDGTAYNLDYEYDQQGIGSDADALVQSAQTKDDYQAAIALLTSNLTNLQAMEANFNDHTPWNQAHKTDSQMINFYKLTGQVIVVSLIEQSMRLYQNGTLVKAFLVTTGQYAKPSPPGQWHVFLRQSPTKFTSSEPKGSAFWYPDTPINYAMEYHAGGYFFHDSSWRVNYGPGTNFPHYDSGGDQAFAGNGSHGCINMQKDEAAWLYSHTGYDTSVVVY